jgi:hypothetical protein
LRPSESTAKWMSPRSTPITGSVSGREPGSSSTTKLAKYRPAASLITVTEDGSDGNGRDQRTETSPILGRRSFRPVVMEKRALRVNRMACLRSLRDRNLGCATLGPFRWPLSDARKFRYAAFRSASACWSTTADTSPSQARSGVALAAVSRADNSASVIYGCPSSNAARRAYSPSLNTTRAQPNALARAVRWPGVGQRR